MGDSVGIDTLSVMTEFYEWWDRNFKGKEAFIILDPTSQLWSVEYEDASTMFYSDKVLTTGITVFLYEVGSFEITIPEDVIKALDEIMMVLVEEEMIEQEKENPSM